MSSMTILYCKIITDKKFCQHFLNYVLVSILLDFRRIFYILKIYENRAKPERSRYWSLKTQCATLGLKVF